MAGKKAAALDAGAGGDRLAIRYVPIDEVVLWGKNPKLHDLGGIKASIRRHGFRDASIYDATLGALAAGNGRAQALAQMREAGEPPPRGVAVDGGGRWCMPVQFGMDSESVAAAESFAVDHNNLTLLGGDLNVYEVARIWDEDAYKQLLQELALANQLPESVPMDDLDALLAGLAIPERDKAPKDGADPGDPKVLVKVFVRNGLAAPDVAEAIKDLLAEHPEWEASVAD